ncbi:MAG: Uncharacterized protein Athens101428_106 [Candidatus Berkelbacteria bacterium Athens1014_28]|uniref:DUF721 domain-containing protein n=1 Tax=Candidatus Berkelbacteria bacterium Athens1014_28 TaxID=2017145 RepID=A0A554LPV3_9BACT|nr:MAG: Uncharacterized protein Athens101428_106 [Candidatus Berkelbacteria bacterium Athens1014_28]
MKALNSLIKKRNKKIVKEIALDDKTIFYIFDRIIKNEYGQTGIVRVRPDYFKKGKLFIKTHSSAWASEIMLDREKIIGKINKEIGKKEVIELVVRS